jgi:glucose-1-phosphate adenylyltransferase
MIRRANFGGKWKFFNEVLADNVENLRIFGFSVKGYAKRINSIDSYFQSSMDMLKLENWREIFHQDNRIYTKIKDEAPAKYMEEARVTDSLVANGCIIEGTVENSILFRKVRVGRNAVIRNSIIMQNTNVGEDAVLNYVICDKDREIQPEAVLEGTEKEPLCIIKHEVR